MTREKILNTPEIVDFMLDKSVIEVSRMKLHKRLEELCKLAIKALEQESNTWSLEDAREDFMDDVYNTLDFLPTNDEANQIIDSFNRVTSSIRREPCEDCISREAVDEYITNLLSGYLYDEERTRLEDLTAYIWELPSVTPTRPTGHWIADVDRCGDIVTTVNGYRCSECCAFNADKDDYCPNCGADMRESEDKE